MLMDLSVRSSAWCLQVESAFAAECTRRTFTRAATRIAFTRDPESCMLLGFPPYRAGILLKSRHRGVVPDALRGGGRGERSGEARGAGDQDGTRGPRTVEGRNEAVSSIFALERQAIEVLGAFAAADRDTGTAFEAARGGDTG